MNILIVDDSKAMRMIVRRTLRQAGFHHEVEEASSGPEALNVLQSHQFDLILCDWNMPEMNGLDLLQKLHDSGKQIKFGFVTSESAANMHVMAKDAGALFFITKPFTPDVFRDALEPILGA
jgi:two-component system chemotaxis response regulator CheY